MSQEFRNRLKEARSRLGISQSQFALKIGVPTRTLIKWENDQATPDAFKLKMLEERINQILSEA